MLACHMTDVPSQEEIVAHCEISDMLIAGCVKMWWRVRGKRSAIMTDFSGQSLLTRQLDTVRRISGSMMRADHTYKFSKALGAVDPAGRRIHVKSSILVIVNEGALVMYAAHVPSDEGKYIHAAIREIVTTPGKLEDSMPKAISTDNVTKDGPKLRELMEELRPGHSVDILQVRQYIDDVPDSISQDVFHVLQRIFKSMPKTHPHWKPARKHMSAIFGKLLRSAYATADEFVASLEMWITEWSSASATLPASAREKCITTGKKLLLMHKIDTLQGPCLRDFQL